MSRSLHHQYTLQDYLILESSSDVKHEFIQGEIFAMAGGTPEHAALMAQIGRILGNMIQGNGCRVFSSELMVQAAEDKVIYPDVTVVCGPLKRSGASSLLVTNPTLVVEVTSESTENWDREGKREAYQGIAGLQEYLIISHKQPQVDLYQLSDMSSLHVQWQHRVFGEGEAVELRTPGQVLRVDDLYLAIEGLAVR